MMASIPSVADVLAFVELGGAVMPALFVLGVAAWTALLLRWMELGAGDTITAQMTRAAGPPGPGRSWRVRVAAEEGRHRLHRAGAATDLMIAAAPLLGLLGTISGMIETFDVLHMTQGLDRSEAMARGISKALITTEFGLLLSIPAILASRAIGRREARHARKFDELEARLAAEEA